jgi:hypothetical protein
MLGNCPVFGWVILGGWFLRVRIRLAVDFPSAAARHVTGVGGNK